MTDQPNRTDNDLLKRNDERQQGWTDAFGKQVANTDNKADIAGHYPYSPERLRVHVNGARQLIQYGSVPEYADIVDAHQLTPQTSGDVVSIRTAERFRYVVQYVTEWSGALQINQALQSGDAITFGYGDADLANSTNDFPGPSADGWFFHWHSGLTGNEVRIAEYRDGTAVSEAVVDTVKQATDWIRYAAETNWYNVGETKFEETYTDAGSDQQNNDLGKVAPPDGKGPQTANKPIEASVKAVNGAPNLTLEVGSFGLRTLGDVTAVKRHKTHTWSGTTGTTANEWTPVQAIRVDSDRKIVNVQISNTDVTEVSSSTADVEALVIAVDPSNTDASGFATPNTHSSTGSVVEITDTVTTAPDSTGTTATSVANPGGYQLGFGSRLSSGSGGNVTVSSGSETPKRNLANGDNALILARSDETGVSVTGEMITIQEW